MCQPPTRHRIQQHTVKTLPGRGARGVDAAGNGAVARRSDVGSRGQPVGAFDEPLGAEDRADRVVEDLPQRVEVDGLGQVMVGAGIARLVDGGRTAVSRNDDNDHRFAAGQPANSARQFMPIDAGHVDVEQRDVGLESEHRVERGESVVRDFNSMSSHLEHLAKSKGGASMIVGHKNAETV